MGALNLFLNRIVTAFLIASAVFVLAAPKTMADEVDLDLLFFDLANPNNQEWKETESQIRAEFFESGSEAMNMLLKRGYLALSQGDIDTAIEHFTALTDHAPDFAEGYNGRATAYYHAGLFGPAVADIARVLSLEPRHFGAMIGLGLIFEGTEKPKQALEVYKKVAILHPNHQGVADDIARLDLLVGGTNL